jgi:arylsulfatase A-like enzyme
VRQRINSIEIEDTYLRLDKELADFFKFLDEKVGKDDYTVFLTADHGAAHAVGYSQNHDIPADYFFTQPLIGGLNAELAKQFNVQGLADTCSNYQITFSQNVLRDHQLDIHAVKKVAIEWLGRQPGITYAIDMSTVGESPVAEPVRSMVMNGYYARRSGPIQLILNAGWFEAHGKTGTTHGNWNPYDTHIPLLFMGWGIHPGHSNRTVYMTDIAPTLAALLHIQMPNGCVGRVIPEVLRREN